MGLLGEGEANGGWATDCRPAGRLAFARLPAQPRPCVLPCGPAVPPNPISLQRASFACSRRHTHSQPKNHLASSMLDHIFVTFGDIIAFARLAILGCPALEAPSILALSAPALEDTHHVSPTAFVHGHSFAESVR